MGRLILHIDLDAFFCAVEELNDPTLKGTTFAVGGKPDQRGVITSCSYPARSFGVHSAMPSFQAIKICPTLRIVSPSHRKYSKISKKVMGYLSTISGEFEQVSVDEAFLEVSRLSVQGAILAEDIQMNINDKFELPCSIGIASNKLVAKIANDYGKTKMSYPTYPNAITIVPEGDEADFLSPLPVKSLWGVGKKTAEKLNALNIFTIGDIVKNDSSIQILIDRFGKHGVTLIRRARGIDNSPIRTISRHPKSISNEWTFSKDISEKAKLLNIIKKLSNKVGKRLRAKEIAASTVKIKIRLHNFSTFTRQISVNTPIYQDDEINKLAQSLFLKNWNEPTPIRLLGVGVSNLTSYPVQMSLWDHNMKEKRHQYNNQGRLIELLDLVHEKHGKNALILGNSMNSSKDNNTVDE